MTATYPSALCRYCFLAAAISLSACASQPETTEDPPPATEAATTETPAPVTINPDEALRFASSQGDLARIQALVAAGANPFHGQGKQPSAVDLAMTSSNPEVRHWASQFLIPARGYRQAAEAIQQQNTATLAQQLESDDFYWYPQATPLSTEAVKHNCSACLSTLQQSGYHLNATDPEGNTALIHAAATGQLPLLQQLLKDMSLTERMQTNQQGDNALHAALKDLAAKTPSRTAVVKALIDSGLSANQPGGNGKTPFETAVDKSWVAGIALLANADNINATNAAQKTPLQQAIMSPASDTSSRDLVRTLIKQGADPDLTKPPLPAPVIAAVQQTKPLTLKTLITNGANLSVTDNQGFTPLMLAALAAKPALVDLLAQHTDTLNTTTDDGLTALQLAVSQHSQADDSDRAEIIQHLAAAGANIEHKDQRGDTALLLAVANQLKLSTQALLDNGADTQVANQQGWTPLMFAVRHQLPAIVTALANDKTSLNLTTHSGWSALHLAIEEHHKAPSDISISIINALIANQADLNLRTDQGITPLYLAATHNQATVIKALLAAGANPNITANAHWTPLMAAVYNNGLAAVAVLIKQTDTLNATNKDGWTALHFAASRPAQVQADIAGLLLNQGASVDALNKGGMTPLQLAAMNNQAGVAQQLLAHGADRYRKNWLGMDAEELAFFSNSKDVLALLTHQ